MLALATHEPHFSILREYVGPADAKPKAGLTAQVEAALLASQAAAPVAAASEEPATPFQFLRIGVLREYLQKEFAPGDYACAGGFDLERVIDDFIFLCFFVGNDFLPHMPSLDIRSGLGGRSRPSARGRHALRGAAARLQPSRAAVSWLWWLVADVRCELWPLSPPRRRRHRHAMQPLPRRVLASRWLDHRRRAGRSPTRSDLLR